MKTYVEFKDLKVGAEFEHNGNKWRKKSSRTAEIYQPFNFTGLWFYFGQKEICRVIA